MSHGENELGSSWRIERTEAEHQLGMFLDSFKQADRKSRDDDFIEILPLIPCS
jgi:hypothetical protein